MNLTLSPETEEYINQRVASGEFACVEAVIEDAIRFSREQEVIDYIGAEKLREMLAATDAQYERGEYKTYSSAREYSEDVKARARKRATERVK